MGLVDCTACGESNDASRKFCGECGAPLSRACPSCGAPNGPTTKFCGECGSALGAQASPRPGRAPIAERRLVSVLFADLVGFTAASEGRDAEDTRELLTRYFDTARTVIERYGGTVEKFIGDAVMAVWGAPHANEDDPERAVRAALDLVDVIPALDSSLQARAGVLTGEAAVAIGAEGQGMVAGDLVNTASRVQATAEPGTVLVGDPTRRATEAAIVYDDGGLRELKGKSEPTPLWRAMRVVAARRGEGRSVGLEAPFVGREGEFRLVKERFHSCAHDRRAALVSVIGVAGIGKSRLAWEFEKYIDGLASDVWWHRGRCLSYGEGVAYWALAEMVRGRAGILEDEDESSALAKLHETLARFVADPSERSWVEPRLQQLLGLIERTGSDRDDLFSAWRVFFERIAEHGTVVLVFEDIHWADAGLIEFVDHLLEWSRARPILVLALARPELHERHPGFGSRGRNATTLAIDPLDDDAMEALLTGLVPGLPAALRAGIRERADGIPLYAVETVRMLLDRGLLVRVGDEYVVDGELGDLAVPETLHALIAARLDGLGPDERALLERAAVLGKTFTVAGLARLGGTTAEETTRVLMSLVRKEVLSLDADPRSPERGQYGFLQALVQRVAYETLSRRDRKGLHLEAAAHLEEAAGIDPDEIAEVIAAHLRDADRADPDAPGAAEVRARARGWLVRAGERAAALAAPVDARRAFEEAVTLTDEPSERAMLLERAGDLALDSNETELAVERLADARAEFTAEGMTHDAARAAARMSLALWNLGRSDEAAELVEEAFAVLVEDEPDADVAKVAAEAARIAWFRGDPASALARVELALDVAEARNLPAVLSEALNTKGMALADHPHESRALLREALAIALEHDLIRSALRAYNNLMIALWATERAEEAEALRIEALELARSRGNVNYTTWFASGRIPILQQDGEWDEAFQLAEDIGPRVEVNQGNPALARCVLAEMALERDDRDSAAAELDLVCPGLEIETATDFQQRSLVTFRETLRARADGRPDDILAMVEPWAMLVLDQGYDEAAASVLGRALDVAWKDEASPLFERVAREIDERSRARRTHVVDAELARVLGTLASRRGDHDEAVDCLARALAHARANGKRLPLARVLADYGAALLRARRDDDAEPLIAEARVLYERMGAPALLERLESLGRDAAAARA